MDIYNKDGLNSDLNLDFEKYATNLTENYIEEGFTAYNVQSILDGTPKASEVKEDLETLVEEGILDKDGAVEESKLPDMYNLNVSERIPSHRIPDETKKIREEDNEYILERFQNKVNIRGPNGSETLSYLSSDIAQNIFFDIKDKEDLPQQ